MRWSSADASCGSSPTPAPTRPWTRTSRPVSAPTWRASSGRAYYHCLGRVWRRSYLLYAPPAPARRQVHVRGGHGQVPRDVDVDLSRTAAGGDDLRALLLHTTLRLLVLVEDLGRYLQGGGGDGEARAARVLCFMDGVASCCARSVARCSPCVGARRARRKENGAAFFLV
jgi:hypothetical protein